MYAIECLELTKVYKSLSALQNLTLRVEYGTSFGLLGENGAGKSTLVRLIMGFIFPTSGQLRVLGQEHVALAHAKIGYVHERPIFDPHVSGKRYLIHLSRLTGIRGVDGVKCVDEMLRRVNLQDVANRSIGTYSKGMQQRLALAQALLADPELLILDEPTSGLDPRSQWEIRQIIQGLRQEGKTILICSHYLSEVEALCDAIAIMDKGRVKLSGSVNDLLQSKQVVEIVLAEHLSACDVVSSLAIPEEYIVTMQAHTFEIQARAQSIVLDKIVQGHIPLISLNPLNQSLEDLYVHATDQEASSIPPHSLSNAGGAS
ncbi:ABC transporter [Dictyobacter alpinus]|uniref:ABC transporter n=1 Tax=Dictyobacter alpinus TaxID=2014873 RepID=A0A402B9T8_9CHLR|nr:ABC transporter ATP-binding protein [Dictyobacter alpinus]GCE28069.1 ABC transporter [Dictyobacter alpinus]